MAIDYKFDGREGCVPSSVSGCVCILFASQTSPGFSASRG